MREMVPGRNSDLNPKRSGTDDELLVSCRPVFGQLQAARLRKLLLVKARRVPNLLVIWEEVEMGPGKMPNYVHRGRMQAMMSLDASWLRRTASMWADCSFELASLYVQRRSYQHRNATGHNLHSRTDHLGMVWFE